LCTQCCYFSHPTSPTSQSVRHAGGHLGRRLAAGVRGAGCGVWRRVRCHPTRVGRRVRVGLGVGWGGWFGGGGGCKRRHAGKASPWCRGANVQVQAVKEARRRAPPRCPKLLEHSQDRDLVDPRAKFARRLVHQGGSRQPSGGRRARCPAIPPDPTTTNLVAEVGHRRRLALGLCRVGAIGGRWWAARRPEGSAGSRSDHPHWKPLDPQLAFVHQHVDAALARQRDARRVVPHIKPDDAHGAKGPSLLASSCCCAGCCSGSTHRNSCGAGVAQTARGSAAGGGGENLMSYEISETWKRAQPAAEPPAEPAARPWISPAPPRGLPASRHPLPSRTQHTADHTRNALRWGIAMGNCCSAPPPIAGGSSLSSRLVVVPIPTPLADFVQCASPRCPGCAQGRGPWDGVWPSRCSRRADGDGRTATVREDLIRPRWAARSRAPVGGACLSPSEQSIARPWCRCAGGAVKGGLQDGPLTLSVHALSKTGDTAAAKATQGINGVANPVRVGTAGEGAAA
jgi:hypothetical protein